MRTLAVVLIGLAVGGCISGPKLHIGMGLTSVMPSDSEVEVQESEVISDILVRVDVMMFQVEASLGLNTYTYVHEDESLTEPIELEVKPFALTGRWLIGASFARLVVGGGLVWHVESEEDVGAAVENEDSERYRILIGAQLRLPADFGISVEASYDFTEAMVSDSGGDMDAAMIRLAATYQF